MVAQYQYQFQIQTTNRTIDPEELERRTSAKRNALAKREENKRTGQKPRELKLPPQYEPKKPYIDRELRQPQADGALGKAIKQAVVETAKQIAPDLSEVEHMALHGEDMRHRFISNEKKAKAQKAYELAKLAHLAD